MYDHLKHSGNHGDVLKHVVLSKMLHYATSEVSPIHYIDTHAGSGYYNLARQESDEWESGIGKVLSANVPTEVRWQIAPYLKVVGERQNNRPVLYPGSPGIAQRMLRPTDRMTLFEHRFDTCSTLIDFMSDDARAVISASDGYKALPASAQNIHRHNIKTIALIDPPYDVYDEHSCVLDALQKALVWAPYAIYIVWRPVLDNFPNAEFLENMYGLGPRVFRMSLDVGSKAGSMHQSEVLVINPPLSFMHSMTIIMPWLKECLGLDNAAYFVG